MPQMTNHPTARVPNEPFSIAGLTIPQVIAMAGAFALAAAAWWALGLLHAGGLGFFFARSIGCGLTAGLLALLAHATFDAGREPFVRPALGYPFRRHVYCREETIHGPTIVTFPARAGTLIVEKVPASLARVPHRRAARFFRRTTR